MGLLYVQFIITVILCCFLFWTIPASNAHVFNNSHSAASTLLKVFIGFRHGNKSPIKIIKSDPYRSNYTATWPEGRGSLTKVGKQQIFELGKKLRARYNHLLGPYYKSEDVTIFSFPFSRTQMSAEILLASLFPPHGYEVWNEELKWQPIPYQVDKVFNMNSGVNCTRYIQELKDNFPRIIENINSSYSEILSIIRRGSGEDDISVTDLVTRVWDTLQSEATVNLYIPDWIKPIYPYPMYNLTQLFINSFFLGTDIEKQLIFRDYSNVIEDFFNSEMKMQIYAWHDLNMVSLSSMLGIELPTWPDPSSCVLIELHEQDKKKQFQVYYYLNHTTEVPLRMEMPCGLKCTEEDFMELIHKYKIDNYDELCRSGNFTGNDSLDHFEEIFNVLDYSFSVP